MGCVINNENNEDPDMLFWYYGFIRYIYISMIRYCKRINLMLILCSQGNVADICVMDDGSFISGGKDDGALVIFNEKYELIGAGAVIPKG